METAGTKNCVLDREAIQRKLSRMALEVAEQNIDEEELLIAGIAGNGSLLADHLARALSGIFGGTIRQTTVHLNKKEPLEVSVENGTVLDGKVIILVDDVANTGRTLLYALKPFLQAYPKKIQTLVLVERSHKLFPVQTDYSGLSIASTLQEHIAVETENGELSGAWLF